jgi:glyoxylase-like metal-dependent hydrolase (beta-lactamase superfamily II)
LVAVALLLVFPAPLEAGQPADALRARNVLDKSLAALGGREKLASFQQWYVEGRGRENLSAELQGIQPDEPTWRPHEEKIAVDTHTLAVAWERRTPRNDLSQRWRRMIFKADSFGVVDWHARLGMVRSRPNPESYRRALARRIPHLLLLDAATRSQSLEWRGVRRIAGRLHHVIEARLPEGRELVLYIAEQPAVLRRVEYLANLPGRGDVTVAWEWTGWKSDPGLGHVPRGHRIRVAGQTYQQVEYTKYSAASPEATTAMLELPARFLAPMDASHAAPPARPSGTATAAPLPATGMVAPGVFVADVGGFRVMFVEFREFVVAFDAPEIHPGLEAIPVVRDPSRLTAEYVALIAKTFPGKPVRYAVISHPHSDHLGGARIFAAAGATLLVAPSHRSATQQLLRAPHSLAPDSWSGASQKESIEAVARRRVITDGTRVLEVVNIGSNPHTAENLFLWLPAESILMQGDLFYYDQGEAFPPSGRDTMNAFFARWLRNHKIEPRAIYGVHNDGAAGPGWLAAALQPADRRKKN